MLDLTASHVPLVTCALLLGKWSIIVCCFPSIVFPPLWYSGGKSNWEGIDPVCYTWAHYQWSNYICISWALTVILESIRQRPSPQCTCDLGEEREPNNWNEEGENMGGVERAVSALPFCSSQAVWGAWYTLAPGWYPGDEGQGPGSLLGFPDLE